MIEPKKIQKEINLKCTKPYGIPECFVDRNCDKDTLQKFELSEQEWSNRNEAGTLANKKYRRAKCWELCVAMKGGVNESPDFVIKQQMRDMRCGEFTKKPKVRLGIGPKLIIGGIILYILLKK